MSPEKQTPQAENSLAALLLETLRFYWNNPGVFFHDVADLFSQRVMTEHSPAPADEKQMRLQRMLEADPRYRQICSLIDDVHIFALLEQIMYADFGQSWSGIRFFYKVIKSYPSIAPDFLEYVDELDPTSVSERIDFTLRRSAGTIIVYDRAKANRRIVEIHISYDEGEVKILVNYGELFDNTFEVKNKTHLLRLLEARLGNLRSRRKIRRY